MAVRACRVELVDHSQAELGQAHVALQHVFVLEDWPQSQVAYRVFRLALVALGCSKAKSKVGTTASAIVPVIVRVVLLPGLAELLESSELVSFLAWQGNSLALVGFPPVGYDFRESCIVLDGLILLGLKRVVQYRVGNLQRI